MAIVGALLGALLGGADSSVLGFFVGILVGWQGVRIAQLRRRVEEAEALVRGASASMTVQARAVALDALATVRGEVSAGAAARSADPAPSPADAAAPASGPATSPGDDVARPAAPAAAPPQAPSHVAAPPPRTPPVGPQPGSVASPTPPVAAPAAPDRAWRESPAPAAMPRAPAEPAPLDRFAAAVKRWFFTGNVPVKLGMVVLFFGVAAALKYAVEQGWLSAPIEFRLAGIAALALAGLVWGWRNRRERPAFGLSLQGGAIGVLLLTVFAAFRMYGVLPPGVALALVVVLVAGAAALAVLQDAVALAVLGFVGGYLAPVLISTGSGNHVALFTYYAVLNAAVFAIAWLRPWRALNLIGFGFTFVIGTLWGAQYFRPELFATVEPFLVLFFLFYVAIPVLYALRDGGGRRGFVDGTLVFGTPLLAFPLQAAMLADDRHALALSALAVAVLYAALAWWLIRRRRVLLLGQAFAALALGFATLAVPLALSARWTCATWALEGAAVAWLGLRQRRWLPQAAGWALQGLAALAYVYGVADGGFVADAGERAVLNGHALSVLLMAGAALLLSRLYERAHGHRALVWLGFVAGMAWWGVAGLRELVVHFATVDASLRAVWFGALTVALSALLRTVLRWPRLGWNIVATAALGIPLAVLSHFDADNALERPALLPWLVWFAALLLGLWRLRTPLQRGVSLAHVSMLATASVLYGLALHETASWIFALGDAWLFLAAIAPLGLLLLATHRVPALGAFPLADLFPAYAPRWFVPAWLAMGCAWLLSLGHPGDADPLPYVPLVNPIELFQLGLLVLAARWLPSRRSEAPLAALVAIGGFVCITLAGLRAVHQYTGADWSPGIVDDRIAQATLTVLWSGLGVAAWIVGSRRLRWDVWLCGAILMGVVLAKLVLIDSRYFGTAPGIVSFLAVGALLVLVGRIAPTPPRQRDAAAESGA
ncbi:DUF2339 domain-containing protein [Chiayiivirga flava]|uniref:Putative membrane protein n=1 Tax=Chiayiivirga flava TaxID=659595 RepID=A0A7W8D5S6_9GAMM|nr:DUF2339 domain-containing protein [Chiayiivirga flava]MBB5208062.1 putative membrane protein [Chiayiivirga flava]